VCATQVLDVLGVTLPEMKKFQDLPKAYQVRSLALLIDCTRPMSFHVASRLAVAVFVCSFILLQQCQCYLSLASSPADLAVSIGEAGR
jgi:hypothetical protein